VRACTLGELIFVVVGRNAVAELVELVQHVAIDSREVVVGNGGLVAIVVRQIAQQESCSVPQLTQRALHLVCTQSHTHTGSEHSSEAQRSTHWPRLNGEGGAVLMTTGPMRVSRE
jgi:hypothetical protein